MRHFYVCLALLLGGCGQETTADFEHRPVELPLHIPSLAQQAKLTAGDPVVEAALGYSVAVSQDTAVIGAPSGEGSTYQRGAYVYTRNGMTWTQQHKLTEDSNVPYFGTSVAMSGDTVVVGAPGASFGGAAAVYVFVRAGAGWNLQQELTASDWQHCGSSVAVSADTLLVGCASDLFVVMEAVHVFVRTGSTWTMQQTLRASGSGAGSRIQFGTSVALSGDTALVGASSDVAAGSDSRGSVYVFERTGSTWSEVQKLTGAENNGRFGFGHRIALSGSTAIISEDYGGAHVFVHDGSQWTKQQTLLRTDGSVASSESVALSGDVAVVGVRDTVGSNGQQGSVYVFEREGSSWTESQRLFASDGESEDYLGFSVAAFGTTIVTGAWHDDFRSGSAYVFDVPSGIVPPDGAPTALGPSGFMLPSWPPFQFTPVERATHYTVRFFNSDFAQRFTAVEAGCAGTSDVCSVILSQPISGSLWRVRGENAVGVGPWSNVLLAESASSPAPPHAPVLLQPSGTIGTTTPTYTWSADTNATRYTLWVNDAMALSTNAPSTLVAVYQATAAGCASGGTCSVTPAKALAPGAGKWWVRAENPLGMSAWSPAKTFTIAGIATAPPVLIAPLGTAVTGTPTYSWNAVTDATSYHLWVNDRSGTRFQQVYSAQAAGCAASTTCTVTPTAPAGTGARTWWVRAQNASGTSPWSARGSFTIGNGLPPGVVTLVSPAGTINTATPTYSWTAVSGATEYWLWVDHTGGLRVNRIYTASEAGCDDGTCAATPPIAIDPGAAKWWIQAGNEAGTSAWVGQAFVVSPL
jgi:hypothetical protein